jgi:hypothetical protein
MDVSHGLITNMKNRTSWIKEHSIGLSFFILLDKNSECNHRWMPSTEKPENRHEFQAG